MEYMLLLYADETLAATLDPAEMAKVFAEFGEVTQDLQARGKLKASGPLQPTSAATTVRVRDGKTVLRDGPFAETKEQLGGYYVIEANDLDEATAVAARIPTTRFGCIEIRPMMRMHR